MGGRTWASNSTPTHLALPPSPHFAAIALQPALWACTHPPSHTHPTPRFPRFPLLAPLSFPTQNQDAGLHCQHPGEGHGGGVCARHGRLCDRRQGQGAPVAGCRTGPPAATWAAPCYRAAGRGCAPPGLYTGLPVAVAKPPACRKLGLQTRLVRIGSDWGCALTHIPHHSVAAHCVSMHTLRPAAPTPAWARVGEPGSPRPAPPHMRLQVVEHVTEGLHNIGEAFAGMMRGGNLGKAVVKVAASDPYPAGVAAPAAAKE